MLPLYVIANGDLFREGLNAVVLILNSTTFTSAITISTLFAILATAMQYSKGRDLMVLVRWFAIYFGVMAIIIGPKVSVQLIDSSNPGEADLTIDQVPYGLAMPASIVTSIGHYLAQLFDEEMQTPASRAYTKTGMLFGSQLFRLGVGVTLPDTAVKTELSDYIKNCAFGDILINHKYTFGDLKNSADIWGLISGTDEKTPVSLSPIRGLYMKDKFMTCQQAAPLLNNELMQAAQNAIHPFLTKTGKANNAYVKQQINTLLMNSYDYYTGVSRDATQILKQNLMMNALRHGIKNYDADTQNAAALENYATTTALEKTRSAWASAGQMAVYVVPLMQTLLLLLMLCLFPVMVLLALQPSMASRMLKNFIDGLIWLETFPIMYAILNFAMTYYLHDNGNASGGLTLSNANPVLLEHSDIAGIAGYFMLAIPFLSGALIKGFSETFTQMSQYLGGVAHSMIQGSASEVVHGNLSLGNTSLANVSANNLSANKHDSNFSNQQGMMSEQMANGAMVTTTASGEQIVNTSSAMSHLPISINAGRALSSQLSHSADNYLSAAQSQRQSFDHATSSAYNTIEAYDHAIQNGTSLSHSYNDGQSANFDQAVGKMQTMAHELAQKEGISDQDGFRRLASIAANENAGFNTKDSTLGKIVSKFGFSAGVSANASQQSQSTHDSSYSHGVDHSISNRDAEDFKKNWNTVKNYAESHQLSDNSGTSASLASKLSSDLRQADTASHNISADLSMGQRLSQMASFSDSHSATIQSNFNQGFVDYVKQMEPGRANTLLTNTSSESIALQRQQLAENYLASYAKQMEQQVTHSSSDVSPGKLYQNAVNNIGSEQTVKQDFHKDSDNIKHTGNQPHFDQQQADHIRKTATSHVSSQEREIDQVGKNIVQKNKTENKSADEKIEQGKTKDQRGIIGHVTHAFSND